MRSIPSKDSARGAAGNPCLLSSPCRQERAGRALLQEHAGLRLVSRWQSLPAALQSSLVALWGPQGLQETTLLQAALPCPGAAGKSRGNRASRSASLRREMGSAGWAELRFLIFCLMWLVQQLWSWGCGFLLLFGAFPVLLPAGRSRWVFCIN